MVHSRSLSPANSFQTWKCIQTIQNDEPIERLVISPRGQIVGAFGLGGYNSTIKLWRVQDRVCIGCWSTKIQQSTPFFPSPYCGIRDVAFSLDEKYLSCVTSTHLIVWDIETGKTSRCVRHWAKFTELHGFKDGNVHGFSRDGSLLAVKDAWGKSIKLLSSNTGKIVGRISSLDHYRHGVRRYWDNREALSLDGQFMANKSDNHISVWRVNPLQKMYTIASNYWDLDLFSLAFSSDSKVLASPTRKATIKLWDVVTGHEISTLSGHSFPTSTSNVFQEGCSSWVVFSRHGLTLASGGEDCTIKIWQPAIAH